MVSPSTVISYLVLVLITNITAFDYISIVNVIYFSAEHIGDNGKSLGLHSGDAGQEREATDGQGRSTRYLLFSVWQVYLDIPRFLKVSKRSV